MRRVLGIVLAVLLLSGVALVFLIERVGADRGGDLTVVRGVIGSEKRQFFEDPEVQAAFNDHGYDVEIETEGSWAQVDVSPEEYDFAFPASNSPARELRARQEQAVVGGDLRPFYSPVVVVAFRDVAGQLAEAGLAELPGTGTGPSHGVLDMAAYLEAFQRGETKFIRSTDPTTSNSGALYLAAASYTANGGKVVADQQGLDDTAPLLRSLIAPQGLQPHSTDSLFADLTTGVGDEPVLIYESQFASLLLNEDPAEDLVLLYPDVTVYSDHSFVPFSENARTVGELLRDDPELRELAVRYGFRPQAGGEGEFATAVEPFADRINLGLDGVRQAEVPTVDIMRRMAERATAP